MRHKRELKIGEAVKVYRNLHTGKLSVQGQTPVGWRIIAHVDAINLVDAKFVVNESGRQRVLREKQKNVHAVVHGTVGTPGSKTGIPVTYNPYKYSSFVFLADEKPVYTAPRVRIESSGRIEVRWA